MLKKTTYTEQARVYSMGAVLGWVFIGLALLAGQTSHAFEATVISHVLWWIGVGIQIAVAWVRLRAKRADNCSSPKGLAQQKQRTAS